MAFDGGYNAFSSIKGDHNLDNTIGGDWKMMAQPGVIASPYAYADKIEGSVGTCLCS